MASHSSPKGTPPRPRSEPTPTIPTRPSNLTDRAPIISRTSRLLATIKELGENIDALLNEKFALESDLKDKKKLIAEKHLHQGRLGIVITNYELYIEELRSKISFLEEELGREVQFNQRWIAMFEKDKTERERIMKRKIDEQSKVIGELVNKVGFLEDVIMAG